MTVTLRQLGRHRPTGIDLICFAGAGESATRFGTWVPHLNGVRLFAAERAGRGRRVLEIPVDDLSAVAKESAEEIVASCSGHLILVGHSVGSLVAHAVAGVIETVHGRPITGIVVCHGRSPTVQEPLRWCSLEDERLMAELRQTRPGLGWLFDRPDFAEAFLPAIRADLNLYCGGAEQIRTPILCIGGRDDPLVPIDHLWRWQEATTGEFFGCLIGGGHMGHFDDPAGFLRTAQTLMAQCLLRSSGALSPGRPSDDEMS